MTFSEDGNRDFLDDGSINFSKRELIFKLISEIQMNQQHVFRFTEDKALTMFLTDFVTADEKELYELSLQREPRGVTLQELIGMPQEMHIQN